MTHASATTIDSIKRSLVGLRMPRALEVLDTTLRRIEQGEIDGIGALDQILIEELTLRENRRVKTALLMARLTAIKTLVAAKDLRRQPRRDDLGDRRGDEGLIDVLRHQLAALGIHHEHQCRWSQRCNLLLSSGLSRAR